MDTNLTLLQSIKQKGDQDSWQLLDQLYSPLIRNWIRRAGVKPGDEDDLVQEIFIQVVRKIESFERGEQTGSFRRWLKLITINCFRNFIRLRGNRALASGDSEIREFLNEYEDPNSELSAIWNEEHEKTVMKFLLATVEPRFKSATWQAFYQTAVKNRPTAEVAEQLSMTPGAIHTAKSRVLAELRRVGQGVLNDSSDPSITD